MSRGVSIHVGLNRVDPSHYQGWDGQLAACEADAQDMCTLAKARGFNATLLLTQQATSNALLQALLDASGALQAGDMLLLTYSGHGGQVPDTNGDEPDYQDETWVLYDRMVVDDELYSMWGKFRAGVRILMLSDSCHSGTVSKGTYEQLFATPELAQPAAGVVPAGVRRMDPRAEAATYAANRALYDGIQGALPAGDKVAVQASVLLFSGCQDNQLSADGDRNGLFTGTLRKVWKDGAFKGDYKRFYSRIKAQMPFYQTPNYSLVGAANPTYERQAPFTI